MPSPPAPRPQTALHLPFREPIRCPGCHGPPTSFPQGFAGRYRCARGHVFHRCLVHRVGVEGPSPVEGLSATPGVCSCRRRVNVNDPLHGRQTCLGCQSPLLAPYGEPQALDTPAEERRLAAELQCLTCGRWHHRCPVHRTLLPEQLPDALVPPEDGAPPAPLCTCSLEYQREPIGPPPSARRYLVGGCDL